MLRASRLPLPSIKYLTLWVFLCDLVNAATSRDWSAHRPFDCVCNADRLQSLDSALTYYDGLTAARQVEAVGALLAQGMGVLRNVETPCMLEKFAVGFLEAQSAIATGALQEGASQMQALTHLLLRQRLCFLVGPTYSVDVVHRVANYVQFLIYSETAEPQSVVWASTERHCPLHRDCDLQLEIASGMPPWVMVPRLAVLFAEAAAGSAFVEIPEGVFMTSEKVEATLRRHLNVSVEEHLSLEAANQLSTSVARLHEKMHSDVRMVMAHWLENIAKVGQLDPETIVARDDMEEQYQMSLKILTQSASACLEGLQRFVDDELPFLGQEAAGKDSITASSDGDSQEPTADDCEEAWMNDTRHAAFSSRLISYGHDVGFDSSLNMYQGDLGDRKLCELMGAIHWYVHLSREDFRPSSTFNFSVPETIFCVCAPASCSQESLWEGVLAEKMVALYPNESKANIWVRGQVARSLRQITTLQQQRAIHLQPLVSSRYVIFMLGLILLSSLCLATRQDGRTRGLLDFVRALSLQANFAALNRPDDDLNVSLLRSFACVCLVWFHTLEANPYKLPFAPPVAKQLSQLVELFHDPIFAFLSVHLLLQQRQTLFAFGRKWLRMAASQLVWRFVLLELWKDVAFRPIKAYNFRRETMYGQRLWDVADVLTAFPTMDEMGCFTQLDMRFSWLVCLTVGLPGQFKILKLGLFSVGLWLLSSAQSPVESLVFETSWSIAAYVPVFATTTVLHCADDFRERFFPKQGSLPYVMAAGLALIGVACSNQGVPHLPYVMLALAFYAFAQAEQPLLGCYETSLLVPWVRLVARLGLPICTVHPLLISVYFRHILGDLPEFSFMNHAIFSTVIFVAAVVVSLALHLCIIAPCCNICFVFCGCLRRCCTARKMHDE
eukprot:TRINITY_DN60012_c1_g2_i1.p1 TRINITY_DN60012_c1_g2~~TRINITY_DN60012_c1_g2_i1.p1  ORF type:complete len:895 (-),score=90.83 TRINITY_DN60012_c1_g2_i1:19-2703(-)